MTDELLCEMDPRFPSGPWFGYFLQVGHPGRHRMELHLIWRDGIVSGEGLDWIGAFTIRGTYDTVTGRCHWVKQYLGKHAVNYEGTNHDSSIRGTWEIRYPLDGTVYVDRGPFHIWPSGISGAEPSELVERATPPLERQEVPLVPAV